MARPSVITDEQILQAAREEFLKKGVGATTAAVAQRARVAEGSIFKRFKTKHELFRAAMHVNLANPSFFSIDEAKAGNPCQALTEVARQILAMMRRLMPVVMMSWSNSPSGLPTALATRNPLPVRALRKLTRLFERFIRAGRLRSANPEIAARLFLGSIQNYVFTELLLQARRRSPSPMAEEDFVREMVDTLWRGLRPRTRKE